MSRSAYRRAAVAGTGPNRRLLAVGAVIAALGAAVAFSQISNAATIEKPTGSDAGKVVNGQAILTDTCVDSKLPPHTGFQDGDRCVSTAFGEVGVAADNPTLLITKSPESVTVNTPFELKVSTRNLIRDRFLAAGKGGYYVESSVLENGLVRGHFHTACRMLDSTRTAPAPDPVPAFFVATEDSKGGATPDVVTIDVPGLPSAGTAQCASWAGDGSHRVPMMQRANQIPGIDSVRINVRDAAQGGGNNGGNTGGGNNGGNNGGGNNSGGNTGGGNTGGGNTGGGNTGGNNGGSNTGGNNGGGNNNGGGSTAGNGGDNNGGGAAPAPTTAPTRTHTRPATNPTTQPGTRHDVASSTPTAGPESTVKPTRTAESTTSGSNSNSDSTNSDSADSSDSANTDAANTDADTPDATTTTPAPKPRSSSKAAGDYTYSNDDGVANSGTKAPTTQQLTEPTASEQKSGLPLTGSNTVAVLAAGIALLLTGLGIMAFTRRRRPGTSTW